MLRRALAVAIVVGALGGAYALGKSAGDDGALHKVTVGASTDNDAVYDKWVTVECPEGTSVIGGGAVVPHGNDTPGVAVYWSAPYKDHGHTGWWAAAQDTARKTRPWLLQVQAICATGVLEDDAGDAGSLPPETFSPAR